MFGGVQFPSPAGVGGGLGWSRRWPWEPTVQERMEDLLRNLEMMTPERIAEWESMVRPSGEIMSRWERIQEALGATWQYAAPVARPWIEAIEQMRQEGGAGWNWRWPSSPGPYAHRPTWRRG